MKTLGAYKVLHRFFNIDSCVHKINEENTQHGNLSSNLNKAIEKSLKIAENISQMWASGDFYDKQKLQYMLFPEGMLYDKENGTVRTTKVNCFFKQIAIETRVSEEIKKGNLLQDCLLGSSVGMAGFEPATSWSQTRRDTGLRYIPKQKYLPFNLHFIKEKKIGNGQ